MTTFLRKVRWFSQRRRKEVELREELEFLSLIHISEPTRH